ncbi:hypothetical protein SpCBS45565_g01977 [Spizellomyces sp. 'palustris']|nr:hypothetical protein SpCBS45565_g01977 [Spizellomyces sp. 'palustris']
MQALVILVLVVASLGNVRAQQAAALVDINPPSPVYAQATFTLNNRLFVLGGVDENIARSSGPGSTQVAAFDYGGTEFVWKRYDDIKFPPTTGVVAVTVGSRVLLTFGAVSYSPEVYIQDRAVSWFDPLTGQIEPLVTQPAPGSTFGPALRYGHSAAYVASRNAIYVYGGYAAGSSEPFNKELWRLDLTTNTWLLITPLNQTGAPLVTVGTCSIAVGKWLVICFGAISGQGPSVNTCEVFDTSIGPNGQWVLANVTGPDGFPGPRSAARVVVDNANHVYVFGGGTFGSNDASYDDIWTFDGNNLPSITWKRYKPLAPAGLTPSARRDHSMVVSTADPSKIIIWGGHDKANDAPMDKKIYVLDTKAETFLQWLPKSVDEGNTMLKTKIGVGCAGAVLVVGVIVGALLWRRRARNKSSNIKNVKVLSADKSEPKKSTDIHHTTIHVHDIPRVNNPPSISNIPVGYLVAPHVPPSWTMPDLTIPTVAKSNDRTASIGAGPLGAQAAHMLAGDPTSPPLYEQLDQFACCTYSFTPNLPDELLLRKGDVVAISQKFNDGWAYGTNINTKQAGTFPINAVKLLGSASFASDGTRPDQDLSPEALLARGAISEITYIRLKELELEMEKHRTGSPSA